MGYTGMPCSAIEHFDKDCHLYGETGKIGYSNQADISRGDILILYGAIGLDKNVVIGQNKSVAKRVLGYYKCISEAKKETMTLSVPCNFLEKKEWPYHIEVQNLSPNFSKKSRDKTILDIKDYIVSDALEKMVGGHTELEKTEAERLIEAIKKYDQ
jgi:hypothetical protein